MLMDITDKNREIAKLLRKANNNNNVTRFNSIKYKALDLHALKKHPTLPSTFHLSTATSAKRGKRSLILEIAALV